MAKRREKTGIYIDLQHLFRIIYAGQFEMSKRDRACIMADTIKELLAINSNFSLSYIEEDKMKYIIRMIAAFENLKFILRFCIDEKMFKTEKTVNAIRERVVKLEEGIGKWRKFINGNRQDPDLHGQVRTTLV